MRSKSELKIYLFNNWYNGRTNVCFARKYLKEVSNMNQVIKSKNANRLVLDKGCSASVRSCPVLLYRAVVFFIVILSFYAHI